MHGRRYLFQHEEQVQLNLEPTWLFVEHEHMLNKVSNFFWIAQARFGEAVDDSIASF